jgi:hypothetical protein
MRPLDIVGLHEVTVITGVRPNTLSAWMRRGHIPAPDARLACGPVWRRSTITAWVNGAGRKRIEAVR